MGKKKALIFGISGQDGAYLADLLLKKNYTVIGVTRNNTNNNLFRLIKLGIHKSIYIYTNNTLEPIFLKKIFKKHNQINEIYFLSGETSPIRSIEKPVQTIESNVISLLKILEFIKKNKKIKFFYASSSEIFEKSKKNIFDENSRLGPRHPYGISKAAGLLLVRYYRTFYNIFCCSGILFNHESPLRSNDFIYKKIVDNAKKIKKKGGVINLGDINVERDVGWAPDYVKAFWTMLQQKTPRDYVIGTGKSYSIKTFLNKTFKILKLKKNKIKANKNQFIRKNEIKSYRSKPFLIKKKLKWRNSLNINKIILKLIDDELF